MSEMTGPIYDKLNELTVKMATVETLQRASLAEQQRCNDFVDRKICGLERKCDATSTTLAEHGVKLETQETAMADLSQFKARIERRMAYVAGVVAGLVLVMEWVLTWAWRVVVKFL